MGQNESTNSNRPPQTFPSKGVKFKTLQKTGQNIIKSTSSINQTYTESNKVTSNIDPPTQETLTQSTSQIEHRTISDPDSNMSKSKELPSFPEQHQSHCELNSKVKSKLEEIYKSGKLSPDDLDEHALKALNILTDEDALTVLDKFSKANLSNESNASVYLFNSIGCFINGKGFDESELIDTGDSKVSDISPKKNAPQLAPVTNKPSLVGDSIVSTAKVLPGSSVDIEQETGQELLLNFKFQNTVGIEQFSPESSFKCQVQPRPCSINTQFKDNPKFKPKLNRKNPSALVTKDYCTKNNIPMGLKDVEKLAESNTNFHKHKVTKAQTTLTSSDKKFTTQTSQSSKTTLLKNSTLEDCIFQLANLETNDEETLPFIQRSLLYKLQLVNSFVSLLKTCPVLNKEIITEMHTLRLNVLELPSGDHQQQFKNMKMAESLNDDSLRLGHTSGRSVTQSPLKSLSNPFLIQTTPALTNKSENSAMNRTPVIQDLIPQNSFKALLDSLPDEFISEKSSISLYKDLLHCGVCNNSFPIDKTILIEHLRNKNHNTNPVKSINKKEPNSTTAPFYQNNPKESDPSSTNYQKLLDVIDESYEKGLVLNIDFYVCIPCDFCINDKDKALKHSLESHQTEQLGRDLKWHICYSCGINIFGTNDHFKGHCSTKQHNKIMNMKNKTVQNESLVGKMFHTDSSTMEEVDRMSVGSSNSDLSKPRNKRLNPHEILLNIAKNNQNMTGSSLGLYCQVCNKYAEYSKSPLHHYETEKHKVILHGCKTRKKYTQYFCATCRVDVFGEDSVWAEHMSLPLHVELATLAKNGNTDVKNLSNLDETQEFPNGSLHFDLMKEVLKKHLTSKSKNNIYGYFCHICPAISFDKQQWKNHLDSASHSNRINSTECVGRNMCHDCLTCNIRMICDEAVFSLHECSLAHNAVCKSIPKGDESNEVIESESDEDSDDSESDDVEGVIEDDSDTRSSTSSKPSANTTRDVINKGIYIKGLPANVDQKEVFEIFKKFGYIKKCTINKTTCSGQILFVNKLVADRALERKSVFVRNTRVTVHPLLGRVQREKRKKKEKDTLDMKVTEVLKTRNALEMFIASLQCNMVNGAVSWNLIKKDLLAHLPDSVVHLFGSQVTGLATKESDFDIYIDYDKLSYFKDLPHKKQVTIIHELLYKFTQPKSSFQVVESIFDARVPIIRVHHMGTNTACDISCRSGLSVENSQLVSLFISSHPRVRWLVVFIKWWMRSNGLLDRSVFTSYAVTWLVFFFLMRPPHYVLCSVSHLQSDCKEWTVAHWDCRFSRDINKYLKVVNKQQWFELLAEFFLFYGSFHFGNVVLCPLTATMIPRKHFEELKLPPAFYPYVNRMRALPNTERLRTNTKICLQDPFDLSHNITKGVSGRDLKKFKTLCIHSSNILKKW